jgi:hypothetical protein
MQMTAIVNRLATDARATLVGSGPRALVVGLGTSVSSEGGHIVRTTLRQN